MLLFYSLRELSTPVIKSVMKMLTDWEKRYWLHKETMTAVCRAVTKDRWHRSSVSCPQDRSEDGKPQLSEMACACTEMDGG